MPNTILFILSSVFLFLCVFVVYLINQKMNISSENLRKIIHISVSNCYFIYILFSSLWAPVIVLVSASIKIFIGIKRNIIQKIFGEITNNRSWGLVY